MGVCVVVMIGLPFLRLGWIRCLLRQPDGSLATPGRFHDRLRRNCGAWPFSL